MKDTLFDIPPLPINIEPEDKGLYKIRCLGRKIGNSFIKPPKGSDFAIVPTVFEHGFAFYFTARGTVFKSKKKAEGRQAFLSKMGYVTKLEEYHAKI